MKRAILLVLLFTGMAFAGNDDVATWVKKLGTSDQKHPFEAMQALTRLGEPVIPAVHKVFRDDKDPTRRWHAAKVLGSVKARAAVADLLVGVEDPNALVAGCAAEALGRIGDRSVLPKLKALEVACKRPNVKTQITKAIEALSGAASGKLVFPWIPWADTIEAARARAKDENKLVLAFVTPWDNKVWEAGYEGARKVAEFRHPNQAAPPPSPITRDPGYWKERAILTAFLGDPAVSNLVATCFIPVRVHMHTWHFLSSGKGTWSDPLPQLGTSAADSHAPAIIFATPSGKCVHRVVRMAVFDPRLFERTCRAILDKNKRYRPKEMPQVGVDPADPKDRADYDKALAALERGDTDKAHTHLQAIARRGEPRPLEARSRLLLDKNGPFPRVWETRAQDATDPLLDSTEQAPGERNAVRAAVSFLLDQQDADGSWPEPCHRHPSRERAIDYGVIVPRTALCVDALRTWRGALKGELAKRADKAIAKGTRIVSAWSSDPTPKVWHLTYALHLELALQPNRRDAAKTKGAARIEKLLAKLKDTEHGGGWTYTGPARLHTFNTAPILLLLVNAKAQGFAVEDSQIARCATFLEQNRLDGKSVFHYGTKMEHMTPARDKDIARASSCFRSPLCELALHAAGHSKGEKRLHESLDVFFDGLKGARSTVKVFESYVDPTSMQDSYRYFFGVWYAARTIAVLPEAAQKKYVKRLRDIIRPLQEVDGSFADSLMVGKASSTALALLAIGELGVE